ncbi:MAG: anti-sigma factor family protein [Candidatus Binatia bacterium]
MVQHQDKVQAACKDFEQELVLYYYGECVGADRNRVETHLEGCVSCRRFLEDLQMLLPLTAKADEPDEAFWDAYSREMHKKLAAVEENGSRWKKLLTFFRPWPVPALATALVLVLALTFTKGLWRSQRLPLEEQALLEILPIAENLDFFKSMEFLDAMDLLEALGGSENESA